MSVRELLIIIGMALITFSIRAVLLVLSERVSLSGAWERALIYIPPAVLTAITLPAILMPTGRISIALSNHYLYSGLAAVTAGILFRRHALWAAIITGLTVFICWKFVFGFA